MPFGHGKLHATVSILKFLRVEYCGRHVVYIRNIYFQSKGLTVMNKHNECVMIGCSTSDKERLDYWKACRIAQYSERWIKGEILYSEFLFRVGNVLEYQEIQK
jgi:hypothetical protein